MRLLQTEEFYIFAGGAGSLLDAEWTRPLDTARIRRYLHVKTVEDYLLATAQLHWEAVPRMIPNTWPPHPIASAATPLLSEQTVGDSAAPLDIGNGREARWDLFVSHASEDKMVVVEPLVATLKSRGWRVWYDRAELTLGDRLRTKIDEGLAHSRFGVIIVSQAFLRKRWPQEELDALFAREDDGQKIILPIWYGVTPSLLLQHSPILAGRLAARWEDGIDHVVAEIERVLGGR